MSDTAPTSERLEALRARWESDRGSRVFLQLADEYRRLGRPGDALRVLEEGLAENPRYPAAQVALGRCQLDLGRPAEAAETLERVVESDPTQMVAYRLLVDSYVAQGRPEEARQRLRIYSLLNDADPDIAELRRRIGQLERQDRSEPAAAEPVAPAEAAASPPTAAPAEEPGLGAEPRLEASAGDDGADDPPPAGTSFDPFPDLAAPPAAEEEGSSEEPFPDLVPPPERRRPEPEEDLFGPAPAPAAPSESGRSGEPFDLDLSAPPTDLDLSSLLGGEAEPRQEATPEAPEEPEEEPGFVLGEAPPEDAPPPGAPQAEEPAPEEVPEPSVEPPTVAMETGDAPEEPLPLLVPGSDREAGRPTVTLGLLYLRQGHTREAEEIFRGVLDRDPDNAEALRHLEEIGEQLRAELAEPRGLTAADLLEGWEGEPRETGTTQRKRYVLERYRDRLRGGAPRDVH